MNRKSFLMKTVATACGIAVTVLMASTAGAQTDPRINRSMANLKAMATNLGAPRLQGEEAVGGKTAPVLYFGKAKINNHFGIVDAISQADGQGMTATFFVKSGDEYIRVSTNVQKPDGRGRAIGTLLDPNGKVIAQIKKGLPFYGEVMIFGVPYITAYEPIKPAGGGVIGIYYVGYQK